MNDIEWPDVLLAYYPESKWALDPEMCFNEMEHAFYGKPPSNAELCAVIRKCGEAGSATISNLRVLISLVRTSRHDSRLRPRTKEEEIESCKARMLATPDHDERWEILCDSTYAWDIDSWAYYQWRDWAAERARIKAEIAELFRASVKEFAKIGATA